MTSSNKTNVADEVAVAALVNRYTNAVNRRDWDTFADCFCEHAIWDVGGPEAAPLTFLFTGRDQITANIRGMVSGFDFHIQTNHAVVVKVDGDRATSSSTLHEVARGPGGTTGQMIYGMYADDI